MTRKHKITLFIVVSAAAMLLTILSLKLYDRYAKEKEFEALPAAILHEGFCDGSGDYSVKAMQYFVYDANGNKMLCEHGEEKVIYPASTTKLVTALVALEYLSPDELITAGEEASFIAYGSSIAYVKSGMTLSAEMLIEGMLLPSGNDAAYVLAAAAGRKIACDDTLDAKSAVEAFVGEMNAFADRNGLCGSHFTSPDGYCGSEHYSTLEDMAIVSSLACKNDLITEYAALHSDSVEYESGETNEWINTNECLDPASKYYNGKISGLKTGSLDGYYNLIAVAHGGDETYIIGVFGLDKKEQRFSDVNKIADALLR